MSAAKHNCQMQIRNEYDVVALRQEVRQLARNLGLGLSQQAKIATAISTVARAVIASRCSAVMSMRADDQGPHPALEVACSLSAPKSLIDLPQLEELLHFGEARSLVDEASLALEESGALLSLRMWLNH
jgi:hypothetical protein